MLASASWGGPELPMEVVEREKERVVKGPLTNTHLQDQMYQLMFLTLAAQQRRVY